MWDFETSPVMDQFAGFSMTGAMTPSTVAGTPIHSRFPTMTSNISSEDDIVDGAEAPASNTRSPRHPARRKGSSVSITSSLHRRGVSFDPVNEKDEGQTVATDSV